MTLEQLETFVHVARARSFSRAAMALGLAQPTLSGRIAALEARLDTRLLVRHGHSVEPTEAGRALLVYAERMLALREEAAESVRQVRSGGRGRLSLGVNPSCSQYLAPRLIEEFWHHVPGGSVHVRTAATPALMEDLQDGTIHLALGSLPQMHPRAEVVWSYSDELTLVTGPSHALARGGICQRSDLLGQTLFSTLTGPTHEALLRLVPEAASQLALEATGGEVMKRLLYRGAGLAVLPRLAIWEDLTMGTLVALALSDVRLPAYEVALACWPRRALSAAAQTFISTVRTVRVPALLEGG